MAVFLMCVDPMEQDTVSTPPRRAAVQKWKGGGNSFWDTLLFDASVSHVTHLRNERVALVPFVGRGLLLPHMNICVLLDVGKNTFFRSPLCKLGHADPW